MNYETRERVEAGVRGVVGLIALGCIPLGFNINAELWVTAGVEIISIAVLVWNWYWKNNNWTKPAIDSQKHKDAISQKNDTPEEFEVAEEVDDEPIEDEEVVEEAGEE